MFVIIVEKPLRCSGGNGQRTHYWPACCLLLPHSQTFHNPCKGATHIQGLPTSANPTQKTPSQAHAEVLLLGDFRSRKADSQDEPSLPTPSCKRGKLKPRVLTPPKLTQSARVRTGIQTLVTESWAGLRSTGAIITAT